MKKLCKKAIIFRRKKFLKSWDRILFKDNINLITDE